MPKGAGTEKPEGISKGRVRDKAFGIALRTALIYGVLGATWILLSDRILHALVHDQAALEQWQIYKGWGFICVTALLLHFGLRAQLALLEKESEARRQAMEALQISEERFQFAMRGTNDGIWDWDLETDDLYLSPRYKLMLGYEPHELADHLDTWRALVHPDDSGIALQQVKAFSEGHSDCLEFEFRMRHKDGHWVHILSRAFAVRRDQRIVRLVGTHVDLTLRKQAEENLRQQEALYRDVLNNVRDVVFQGDLKGRWTFLNSAWEKITGYSVEESIGRSFMDFVHPEDREENWNLFEPMMLGQEEYCQHAVRYLHKGGGFRCIEVHAQLVRNPMHACASISGTLRDITDRRAADEALRKSEEHLRHAAEVAGVGTFEHNHLTNIVYLSPSLRKIHEFDESEPVTMASFMNQIYPDDRPSVVAAMHQAHRPDGDGRAAFDLRIVTPSAQIRWLRSRSQSFFEGEGKDRRLVRTIGAAVEITEMKEAERALRERENLYRAVIETSADGFLMLDLDGQILEANDSYSRSSGYSRDELLSMNVDDLEAASESESLRSRLDQIRRSGSDLFETVHRTQDDTLWEAEVDVAYWPIAGGRLFAFVRNLNERKRSEAFLRIRVELSRLAEEVSPEELLQHALDRIERVTSSRIGCIHFVDLPAKVITLQACSSTAKQIMGHQFSREQLPVNESAVLARALETREPVIENDCDTEHLRIDEVTMELRLLRRVAVPVFQQGQITAVVCIANKNSDYTADDVSAIQEIASIVMDLFARKRAEEALHETEQRLQLAVTAAGIGYWEMSLPSGKIKWSEAFAAVMGCSPEDLPPNRDEFLAQVDPLDAEAVAGQLQRTIEKRTHFNCEFRYRWPDGAQRWHAVSGRVAAERDSEPERLTGVAMDVTSRKVAEEALRRSEERYRALVDTTFDWIWELDAEMKFTFSSPRVFEVLGYRPAELAGKHYGELLDPQGAERVLNEHHATLAFHRAFTDVELECLHRAGLKVILESSAVPVFGANGEFLGYRGSSRNITERKVAEKHRQALETQLRQSQKMEAIGTLAGGVAHDFNNILTVIHGNASLLLLPQMAQKIDKGDCAQQIVRAADRAAGLTRQLLMFSRKQMMQISNVNLNNVVAHMTKMLQRIVGEDITLQTTYAPTVGLIRGDVGMLEQILLNLVVNARDAMPHGGQLNIGTGTATLSEAEAGDCPDAAPGPHVWLSVTDTGCGMGPDIVPRIFEPFFTTKEVGKGTGLGLATVYGIVKQHNGWITVSSEPGKGSAFKIFFPAMPPAAAQQVTAPEPQELPRGTEMLMVVEDDLAVRNLMIHLLERCGYRVLQASSGRAALELWKEHRAAIDLLITDLVMPDGVTGLQLADKVRSDRPDLRVIYVTGYSAELAAKGTPLVEGVNFLQKPFSPESLVRAVRKLLDSPMLPPPGPEIED
ncbi:MAG TPA: PAS domain S-box protein [Verrucomicrobiae bacterium]|nr:PAS domain S-box protein [Verrucomicrobiae bacterium]